jgi:hypothetical protein
MSNFTDQEQIDAVSKYVKSDLKTERTDLGPLSTDYTYQEVLEFAASVFLFDPSSIFYLLSLGANKVNQKVISALEYLDDIITAVDEVGKDTQPVEQTSLLEDAASSLLKIEQTINTKNVVSESQFGGYTKAVDKFIDVSLTPNVLSSTGLASPNTFEIVRPPQQAQAAIKTATPSLRTTHQSILSEASQLTDAISELLSQDLSVIAVQKSVNKIRTDLRALKTAFDSATVDGAIELTRDAFLDLNAGKAVINNLTSITDPREPRMESTSSSSDRARAASPAVNVTSAKVTGSKSGPFHIIPTTQDTLIFSIDSGSDQPTTFIPEDPAFILGTNDGPFDIHDSQKANLTSSSAGPYTVPASPDDIFDIYVDGIGYRATLTSGSRTAAQIAVEVDAATRIDGEPGTFSAVATASDSSGSLKFEHDTLGAGSVVIGDQTTLNTAIGFTDGQDSNDTSSPSYLTTRGVDANNSIRFLVDDINFITASLTNGATRTAAQVASDIAAASVLIDASTEVVEANPSDITVVKVLSLSYGDGSYISPEPSTSVHELAMSTLGFTDIQESRSSYLDIDDAVSAISLTGATASASKTTLQSGTGGTAVKDGSDYKLKLVSGTITASITTDDMLLITGGENGGWYTITTISLGGAFDELTLGVAA